MSKVYQQIAGLLNARANCERTNNVEWQHKHTESLLQIVYDTMPHGSGIDLGCRLDLDQSSDRQIVIHIAYYCMNENGYYDGWRDFTVYVTPSMVSNFDLRITGRDYNGVKEYLYQLFNEVLDSEYVREQN